MRYEIRVAFNNELEAGYRCMREKDFSAAYRHFERAHIIGQRWIVPHTRSHWAFLLWGFRMTDVAEVLGQCLRLPVGIVGSAVGWLPVGNTGGANVRSTQPMPLPDDLKVLLRGETGNS